MTTATSTAVSRRSRLQFSLRLLLLALTAFAIGFPIWYRWPFEEVEREYSSAKVSTANKPYATITRTWRRKWGGGKVQHGRTVNEREGGSLKFVEYFENGQRHG